MNKPKLYWIIVALLAATACKQNSQKVKEITLSKSEDIEIPPAPDPDQYLRSNEKERYAIFPLSAERDSSLLANGARSTTLSRVEILKMEQLIKKEVLQYNKKALTPIKSPEKYFKQITPYILKTGQKEIWVDCFCSVTKEWKKFRDDAKDGGNCFLHFKIDLTKDTVLIFFTNGEG